MCASPRASNFVVGVYKEIRHFLKHLVVKIGDLAERLWRQFQADLRFILLVRKSVGSNPTVIIYILQLAICFECC